MHIVSQYVRKPTQIPIEIIKKFMGENGISDGFKGFL